MRGAEGAGSAGYFSGFGAAIVNPDFAFTGRNRRPPRDPVNACLSFGYALLTAMVTNIAERVGLDPMVGALHDLDYGRPSLALDLIEEWRPVLVDSVVLRLVNRRQITPWAAASVRPAAAEGTEARVWRKWTWHSPSESR